MARGPPGAPGRLPKGAPRCPPAPPLRFWRLLEPERGNPRRRARPSSRPVRGPRPCGPLQQGPSPRGDSGSRSVRASAPPPSHFGHSALTGFRSATTFRPVLRGRSNHLRLSLGVLLADFLRKPTPHLPRQTRASRLNRPMRGGWAMMPNFWNNMCWFELRRKKENFKLSTSPSQGWISAHVPSAGCHHLGREPDAMVLMVLRSTGTRTPPQNTSSTDQ